jgi:quercetin dioxygenase-like cupin family protein
MPQPTRRIVTGHDERGRSVFLEDRPSPHVHVFDRMGGTAVTELWSTPEPGEGRDAAAGDAYRLEPSPGASKFRVVEYPPDSVRFAGVDRHAAYEAMGARHAVVEGARHPGMHKTRSIDYAIVLSGEIWALMDEGEVLMKPGDVLIQRETSHAWSNRTDKPARVAFVLIGTGS